MAHTQKSEPAKSRLPLIVVLEGGLITAVLGVPEDREVFVIDYDTDGADPGDISRFHGDDGQLNEGCVVLWGEEHHDYGQLNGFVRSGALKRAMRKGG